MWQVEVPKTCYLYWNNAPMSLLHTLTLRSFHVLNPEWEIIVHNFIVPGEPTLAPAYKDYIGRDYFHFVRECDYVQVIDIEADRQEFHSILISDKWRRKILYENGGVYSDFDVLWLKPMDYFMNIDHLGDMSSFNSIVSYWNYTEDFHNVSVLISKKGNPFDEFIIQEQEKVKNYTDDQAFGTTLLNELYPNYDSIDIPGIIAIKYETFYPYSTFDLKRLFIDDDITALDNPNVMAIHWFNGNPLSKLWINNSLYNAKCSMNTILKREGYV